MDSLGAFYDYDGIMHYSNTAFSKNGRETIQPVRVRIRANGTNTTTVPDISFGQRYGFSDTDVIQINALYRCQSKYTYVIYDLWTLLQNVKD